MELFLSAPDFDALRRLVYQRTGIQLADGKRLMLQSRLARRLRVLNLNSFQEYYQQLLNLPEGDPELTEFTNAVTTNKTEFYREPHHFHFVIDCVLPEIELRAGQAGKRLSVWHAGCSSGEEPYTLSIELHEALAGKPGWEISQLATDIDTAVLRAARRGEYDVAKVQPIRFDLWRKYLLRGTGKKRDLIKVKPILSEWLKFNQLNLLSPNWPFSLNQRFDVIFCRNVMIYFDQPTQQKLVERFWDQLVPGGYLMIGHSESLYGINEQFEALGSTIYRKSD